MRIISVCFAVAASSAIALVACRVPIAVPVATATDTTQVLSDLSTIVITRTYADMESGAAALELAAQALAATTTDANLTAAKAAAGGADSM